MVENTKKPRNKKAWHPNETRSVLLLIANGYGKEEISRYVGRGPSSIDGLMGELDTSIKALRAQRGLSRREMLLRQPLPPYDPETLYHPAEEAFPTLTLLPAPAAVQKVPENSDQGGNQFEEIPHFLKNPA